MTIHEIVIEPKWFDQYATGRLTSRICQHDQDFQAGDTVWLREWSPGGGFTGRWVQAVIGHVLAAPLVPCAFDHQFCVLSLQDLVEGEPEGDVAGASELEELAEPDIDEVVAAALADDPEGPAEPEGLEVDEPGEPHTVDPTATPVGNVKAVVVPAERQHERSNRPVDAQPARGAIVLCQQQGWSVPKIAELAGVSAPTIYNLLKHQPTCSAEIERRLLEAQRQVDNGLVKA